MCVRSAIIKEYVKKVDEYSLTFKDYDYILKDLKLLSDYLKNTIKTKQKGVNILFYGVAGTGKTELAKTIAKKIDVELFEVSYVDDDGASASSIERLSAYKTAQALLKNKSPLLMYDEAEDIFDSSDNFFSPKKQENKAWINRMLESNPIPTIWITNDIDSIDEAIVRRFDITIEMKIPKRKKRVDILKKYANDMIEEKTLKKLSKSKYISPAVMQRAIKVALEINSENFSKTVYDLIDKTLKAQRYPSLKQGLKSKKDKADKLPKTYDPAFINADEDLEELALNIAKTKNARLCLYGVPGTGKSAYGKYIAKKLGKKAIVKKGSDLLSKWIGGTEANIAAAFKEAKQKKAVLIFDEVDSFLQDRTTAHASWEVTQVNEMLTQMESFHGIFIATTNLIDNLDQASLRRFDLKMEFSYLNRDQSWKLFAKYVKEFRLSVTKKARDRLSTLRYLTPGDFAAVARQNRFRSLKSAEDFVERLAQEVSLKDVGRSSGVMGFL